MTREADQAAEESYSTSADLDDEVEPAGLSRREIILLGIATAVGTALGLRPRFQQNRSSRSDYASVTVAEADALSPERRALDNLLDQMKSNPNPQIREAAMSYPQVNFTSTEYTDSDSREVVAVVPSSGTNSRDYILVINRNYLNGTMAVPPSEEVMQMNLYKGYFILEEAKKSPMAYGLDRVYSAQLEQKAESISQQLFPKIAQNLR